MNSLITVATNSRVIATTVGPTIGTRASLKTVLADRKQTAKNLRDGLKTLLVSLMKGIQLAAIDIDDGYDHAIFHDGHDDLRLRLRGASNMARKRMNVGDNQRPRLSP